MKTLRCRTYDNPGVIPPRRQRVLAAPLPDNWFRKAEPKPAASARPTRDTAPASKPGRVLVAKYGPGKFELETDENGIASLFQVYDEADAIGESTSPAPNATMDRSYVATLRQANAKAAKTLSNTNAANAAFWGRK